LTDVVQVLSEMRNGRVLVECGEKLADVLKAVRATGKKGRLSLVLDFNPSRIVDQKVTEVDVTHKIVTVEPENSPGTTMFFVMDDGSLTRTDPDQMAFELKDAPDTAKEIKK
jgi:hypothetical protein